MPPEFWGFCGECKRWFYCENGPPSSGSSPRCPVCMTEALAVEERAA